MGCVDANGDGTTDLVGLKYVPEPQGAGTIQRTIVTLTGPQARNGATDTVPVTRASMADEAHVGHLRRPDAWPRTGSAPARDRNWWRAARGAR